MTLLVQTHLGCIQVVALEVAGEIAVGETNAEKAEESRDEDVLDAV
jgi:hypothetical protein